jgi:hypothetical protein
MSFSMPRGIGIPPVRTGKIFAYDVVTWEALPGVLLLRRYTNGSSRWIHLRADIYPPGPALSFGVERNLDMWRNKVLKAIKTV